MPKQHNNKGFTLIELLVSMGIITFAILGMFTLVLVVVKGNLHSKRVTIATNLAQKHLEKYVLMDYGNSAFAGASGTEEAGSSTGYTMDYNWVVDVQRDVPAVNMCTIIVDVFWSTGGANTSHNNVELKTIRAQYYQE